jgi:ribosome biogenesis GTPase A
MKRGFWIVVREIIRRSDVILEVLDSRMPELTRNKKFEAYAKKYGKKVILVFNKTDLVSRSAAKNIKSKYKHLDHISISSKKSKGIKELIKEIKSRFKKDDIRVAIIGYPNTGKSTLINQLSRKGKARTSSESGFTKGLQLIAGKDGLRLIDTPGVVPYGDREEILLGLTSAISPSKLNDPDIVAYELIKIFKRNNPAALEKEYNIDSKLTPENTIIELAKQKKMLLKKGAVDERRASIQLLTDWHKGKIRI